MNECLKRTKGRNIKRISRNLREGILGKCNVCGEEIKALFGYQKSEKKWKIIKIVGIHTHVKDE